MFFWKTGVYKVWSTADCVSDLLNIFSILPLMSGHHWRDSMSPCIKPCVLKDINGLIVTVRKYPNGLKLCAVERQTAIINVCVCERMINEMNQMAFCFQYKDGTLYPKVDGKCLKLEKIDRSNLTESHWFEKDNLYGGKHYGLRSVVEPSQYLSLDWRHVFCLRASRQDCVRVTDEKIES